jgi:hypothetical protein
MVLKIAQLPAMCFLRLAVGFLPSHGCMLPTSSILQDLNGKSMHFEILDLLILNVDVFGSIYGSTLQFTSLERRLGMCT